MRRIATVLLVLLAGCKPDANNSDALKERMSKAVPLIDSLPLPVASGTAQYRLSRGRITVRSIF